MKWLALFLNVLAIVLGGGAGMMLGMGKSARKRLQDFMIPIGGLVMVGLAFVGGLDSFFLFGQLGSTDKQLEAGGMILAILFLALGWIFGHAFMLDTVCRKLIETLTFDVWHLIPVGKKNNVKGNKGAPLLSEADANHRKKQTSNGFVMAVIAFAVSPMAVLGATASGSSVLFIKSAVDFVLALILGMSCGIGVVLSAAVVWLVELLLMLLTIFSNPIITDTVVHQMAFIGACIMAIAGVNFAFGKEAKVANFLPAFIVPPLFQLVVKAVYWLTEIEIAK